MNIAKLFIYRPFHLTRSLILVVLLCAICIPKISKAQNQSVQGEFEVSHIIGCAPFTLSPTLTNPVPGSVVAYDYENTMDPTPCLTDPNQCQGLNFVTDPTFTYTNPGTYYLTQVLALPGAPAPVIDFIEITVLEPSEPQFTVDLCAGNEVTITFNFGADQYDFYEIDFGDGQAPTNLSKGGSSVISYPYAGQGNYTIVVSGKLNTGNDVNCGIAPPVNITTLDAIPVPFLSEIISETQTSLTLRYQALDPNISYDLEYNIGNGFQTLQAIDPTLNPTELLVDQSTFDNFQEAYGFRIKASDPCNSNEEFSNQASSIALNYTLTSINNTIDITYTWSTNELVTPLDLYQNGGVIFSTGDLVGNTLESYNTCAPITDFFMEKIVGATLVRSMVITPLDNQNLDLPAPAEPTGALIDNNVELVFEPTPFPFSLIEVFRKDGTGNYSSIGTTTTLDFTDFGVSGNLTEACYIIQYTDECGNISLASSETCVPLEGLLRTPNAFTPNGDGVNDTFDVGSGVFTNFRMFIFNKWGGLVYEGTNPTSGWDGNIGGQEAPLGTYLFKISYLKSGVEIVSTGTVTLIR